MSETTKDQRTEKPMDFRAINPRYRGAKASDVVRAMVTDPKVRERLLERWRKRGDEPGVNSSR